LSGSALFASLEQEALQTPDKVRRPRLAAGGLLAQFVQKAGDLVGPGEAVLETGAEPRIELVQKRLFGSTAKAEVLQFVSRNL